MPPDAGQDTQFTMQEFAQALIDRAEQVDLQLRGYMRENHILRSVIKEELRPNDCSCEYNSGVVRAVENEERIPDMH